MVDDKILHISSVSEKCSIMSLVEEITLMSCSAGALRRGVPGSAAQISDLVSFIAVNVTL